jgi:hypothetical protein
MSNEPEITPKLLREAEKKNVSGGGYGYILSHSTTWFPMGDHPDIKLLANGLLYVAEFTTAKSATEAEYHARALIKALTGLTSPSFAILKKLLDSRDMDTFILANKIEGESI